MSSILDALKKVERESITDRGEGTPWPAPAPAQTSYRSGTRRWWIPLGIAAGVCVCGLIFWQVRQVEWTRPAGPMPAAPPPVLPYVTGPASDTQKRMSIPPVAQQKQTRSARMSADAPPRKARQHAPAHAARPVDSVTAAPPVPPETIPSQAATPEVPPSLSPPQKRQVQTAAPPPRPVAAPADDTTRRSTGVAAAPGQPLSEAESDKNFRNDPRISLQALVWAPEAAARFVVINNRLVKEGGSVDNIVVVRINPDDVLLADGSDRWHEAFKIR